MGLYILCEVRYPGNPPVQIRENSEHLRNRRLELAELCPSETNSFRGDLALVCDQSMPLRGELADPQKEGAFEGSKRSAFKDGSLG